MEGSTKEAIAKLEANAIKVLVDNAEGLKLPTDLVLGIFEDMTLLFHPHANIFKFSVLHYGGQRFHMPNLTDLAIWCSACKPGLDTNTLMEAIALEVKALELSPQHLRHFIMVGAYIEALDLGGFS